MERAKNGSLKPSLWAVVPVKDLANAKQRLAGLLDPAERRSLFRAMTEDVLTAVAASRRLAGLLVVTRDPEAIRLAERYEARILIEEQNRGHTAASSLGAATLAAEGARGMVQFPADLPLLTAADVDAVLEAHGPAPSVTIAPARDGRGSNAVACSPPDLLPLAFGDDSFVPHVAHARALGIEPGIVRRPALALDIDTPDDLRALLATPARTRAHACLEGMAIAGRMRGLGAVQS